MTETSDNDYNKAKILFLYKTIFRRKLYSPDTSMEIPCKQDPLIKTAISGKWMGDLHDFMSKQKIQ